MSEIKKVYQQISEVQKELCRTGIGKDGENTIQNYKFRGIDAVYNVLSPFLAKHKLCILPNVLERHVTEGKTQYGKTSLYVTLKIEYTIVCSIDNSEHKIVVYGDGSDTSDKATNKAMSAAYKYAAFQTFCIPVEGDNDSENPSDEEKQEKIEKEKKKNNFNKNKSFKSSSPTKPSSSVEFEQLKAHLQMQPKDVAAVIIEDLKNKYRVNTLMDIPGHYLSNELSELKKSA